MGSLRQLDNLHQNLKNKMEASDIQAVVQQSLAQRNAKLGLKEVARLVAQGNAAACFLATDVSEKEYKAVIEGLCKENKTPLLNVDSKETLGLWCGLSKVEGEVTRSRSCGVMAIKTIPNTEAGNKFKEALA